MKGLYEFIVILISVPLLISCTTKLDLYENRSPAFSMTQFFSGQLCAKGLVRNRDASVNRKFVADIIATSGSGIVTLDESFLFDNGERQKRVWEFHRQGTGWLGQAGDVVGEAIAETKGDTLHLNYQLKIEMDGDELIIDMDDWLHLVDENTLMGSTQMTKWGFDVGQIDIFIQKSACVKN